MKKIYWLIIFVFIFFVISYSFFYKKVLAPILPISQVGNNQNIEANQISTTTSVKLAEVMEPISGALGRVSKKPFGIKISPQDSPVKPEKFSGYHTGVDFETTMAEQDTEVPVYALCSGQLLLKKYATGYGGVVVQSCHINKEDVTIVYGHLRLSSISAKINQEIKMGEQLGFLGRGFSAETDGERKHLHLSIHRGSGINILGYVRDQVDLEAWINIIDLIK